ncbi:MAG: DUF423 domain-containing protein [Anaerolineales bacterium]
MENDRFLFMLGSIAGLLAVALGAFGAHALRAVLQGDMESTYQTAVRYHLVHALALLAVAWAASQWQSSLIPIAGYAFIAGLILFSGSLYALSLTGIRLLGAITPFGGVAFILGWALLAVAAYRG